MLMTRKVLNYSDCRCSFGAFILVVISYPISLSLAEEASGVMDARIVLFLN
jgi:hypothetical protein